MESRDYCGELKDLAEEWLDEGNDSLGKIKRKLSAVVDMLGDDLLRVGSHTTGGTGYITRIIKAAQNSRTVRVLVEEGEHQDDVYKSIVFQLAELEKVASLDFNVVMLKGKTV